ncbi:hypothetical protein [Halpernia frigidisoli]|uniref:Heat induced stress protein YflT n=1 Tax=Halpernia frigidisoli TaxID=1125876 RepID=A0A1I3E7A2_9FLAO|nr:hypothetical protein [Halpernia frigidisoli]SFH94836.1 hypothetical protein SAMN05443292_0915 [Halpernia frigidisoli]
MSYTIVGMFPKNEQAESATEKLTNLGFTTEDYHVSKFNRNGTLEENDYSADDHPHFHFEEEEKTSGFWNWLFGDEENTKKKYSYAATKNNVVTVFADTLENAEKAKTILNDEGAINIHNESKNYVANQKESSASNYKIDEDEQAKIISKAKNNLYFTDERRYVIQNHDIGMRDDMDSQGHSNDPL